MPLQSAASFINENQPNKRTHFGKVFFETRKSADTQPMNQTMNQTMTPKTSPKMSASVQIRHDIRRIAEISKRENIQTKYSLQNFQIELEDEKTKGRGFN